MSLFVRSQNTLLLQKPLETTIHQGSIFKEVKEEITLSTFRPPPTREGLSKLKGSQLYRTIDMRHESKGSTLNLNVNE